ncbi:MAG: hypothetical protein JWN15_924 [Firmicutes bacterium]|nr:hypothetical protein [Bacillota bacterium]
MAIGLVTLLMGHISSYCEGLRMYTRAGSEVALPRAHNSARGVGWPPLAWPALQLAACGPPEDATPIPAGALLESGAVDREADQTNGPRTLGARATKVT